MNQTDKNTEDIGMRYVASCFFKAKFSRLGNLKFNPTISHLRFKLQLDPSEGNRTVGGPGISFRVATVLMYLTGMFDCVYV